MWSIEMYLFSAKLTCKIKVIQIMYTWTPKHAIISWFCTKITRRYQVVFWEANRLGFRLAIMINGDVLSADQTLRSKIKATCVLYKHKQGSRDFYLFWQNTARRVKKNAVYLDKNKTCRLSVPFYRLCIWIWFQSASRAFLLHLFLLVVVVVVVVVVVAVSYTHLRAHETA